MKDYGISHKINKSKESSSKSAVKSSKKNFILDTNVILHDYNCLYNFEENDIYLPIVLLEELDKFKKGNNQINYNARAFLRELDKMTDTHIFTEGITIGENLGKIYVYAGECKSDRVKASFPERKPDNQFLAVTDIISKKNPDMTTILITKDVNLRMKARSLGLISEDYINDKVADIDDFAKKTLVLEDIDPRKIDMIYGDSNGIKASEIDLPDELLPNECMILKSDSNSVLARYNPFTEKIVCVNKVRNYGIEPKNAEQSFAFDILNDPNIKLIALTGKAGTGKTLLALAAALNNLHTYKQILLARPIVSLSDKDIGFLPGTAQEKISPYMQPLFDNLNVIKHQFSPTSSELKRIEEMQNNEQLVIEALAYIRGRSLSDTYCIIDEAQNLTPHEVKTIITRAGENTKMIFTGDIQQIDTPYLDHESNGLVYMIDRMRTQNLFGHINLIKGERSELSELASNLL